AGSAANAASWSPEKARRTLELTQHFLKPDREPPRAPAISIAIGLDGRLLLAEGLGEETPGHRASAHTIYRIGSLTTQLTAAESLRMSEERTIAQRTSKPMDLDTHVSDVSDGVGHWQASWQAPITPRSIRNMTSNLPNFTRRPPD